MHINLNLFIYITHLTQQALINVSLYMTKNLSCQRRLATIHQFMDTGDLVKHVAVCMAVKALGKLLRIKMHGRMVVICLMRRHLERRFSKQFSKVSWYLNVYKI